MKYKYPRTFHLPWSDGITNDDKVIDNTDIFKNRRVIVTEKMDGECTTIGNNYTHARSLYSKNHPSRDWLKRYSSTFQYNLGEDTRICGENLYAKHSIEYRSLKSYFYAFSLWYGTECLSWDDTMIALKDWGIETVPILYDGIYNERLFKLWCETWDSQNMEGYVIRLADSFEYDDFKYSVAKYVRKNHVKTDKHWMNQEIIVNGIT